MRVGLFCDSSLGNNEIKDIADLIGSGLVGLHVTDGHEVAAAGIPIIGSVYELMASSDAVLLFTGSKGYEVLAPMALRRGMPVFISKLPECSPQFLSTLSSISGELSSAIGFGFSGMGALPLAECGFTPALYVAIRRELAKGAELSDLIDLMVFDTATFIGLAGRVSVRRVRASAFPFSGRSPMFIDIRVELSNGGLLNYTAQRMSARDTCSITLFDNGMLDVKAHSWVGVNSMPCNISKDSLKNFLEGIAGSQRIGFPLVKAIDTLSIAHQVKCQLDQLR